MRGQRSLRLHDLAPAQDSRHVCQRAHEPPQKSGAVGAQAAASERDNQADHPDLGVRSTAGPTYFLVAQICRPRHRDLTLLQGLTGERGGLVSVGSSWLPPGRLKVPSCS